MLIKKTRKEKKKRGEDIHEREGEKKELRREEKRKKERKGYVMDKFVRINIHFHRKVTKYFSISNRIGDRIIRRKLKFLFPMKST